jgi:hypothetical protein
LFLAGFESGYFGLGLTKFQAGRYGGQKFFVLPGFEDEIRGSLLDGLYRHFDIAVGGNHDHDRRRVDFKNPVQPEKTFLPAGDIKSEIHVQKDDIEILRSH